VARVRPPQVRALHSQATRALCLLLCTVGAHCTSSMRLGHFPLGPLALVPRPVRARLGSRRSRRTAGATGNKEEAPPAANCPARAALATHHQWGEQLCPSWTQLRVGVQRATVAYLWPPQQVVTNMRACIVLAHRQSGTTPAGQINQKPRKRVHCFLARRLLRALLRLWHVFTVQLLH